MAIKELNWLCSNITTDAIHRFVTDTQINTWNAKADASHTHDDRYYTESEIDKLTMRMIEWANLATDDDLDKIIVPGFYRTPTSPNTISNTPVAENGRVNNFGLLVFTKGTEDRTQILIAASYKNMFTQDYSYASHLLQGDIFIRHYDITSTSSKWSAWTKIGIDEQGWVVIPTNGNIYDIRVPREGKYRYILNSDTDATTDDLYVCESSADNTAVTLKTIMNNHITTDGAYITTVDVEYKIIKTFESFTQNDTWIEEAVDIIEADIKVYFKNYSMYDNMKKYGRFLKMIHFSMQYAPIDNSSNEE